MWAKCTLFDAGTHAPMIIAVPGLTDSGTFSRALTEHVDLMPTLVAAAGLPLLMECPPEVTGRALPALCIEGQSLLPLMQAGGGPPNAAVRKASYSQWPHPFASRPSAMGYSIRVKNARYTEWVKMHYGSSTPTTTGIHIPQWDSVCAHELYLYANSSSSSSSDSSASWAASPEIVNVADDAAHAVLVQTLRAQLHAGWRVAAGAGPWPALPVPQPLNSTQLREPCPITKVPDKGPPTPPTPPTPAP